MNRLLGTTVDYRLTFRDHNKSITNELRRRVSVVRRLRSHIPNRALLSSIARALVVGRLQVGAWVTHAARLGESDHTSGCDADIAVVLNDLARILLGVRCADCISKCELINRMGLPTLNEVVVRKAGVAAWKAAREGRHGALNGLLLPPDPQMRAASQDLYRPLSHNSVAAMNMARTWAA